MARWARGLRVQGIERRTLAGKASLITTTVNQPMNTSLKFSDDLLAAVDKLAKEMGISRSDLFRKAMERYLEQQAAIAEEASEAVHASPSRHSKPMVVLRSRHVPDDEDW